MEGILLGLLLLPLCVWAIVSPRTLHRRLTRDPNANEPGNAAYALVRLVAFIPIAALLAMAVLSSLSSGDDPPDGEVEELHIYSTPEDWWG